MSIIDIFRSATNVRWVLKYRSNQQYDYASNRRWEALCKHVIPDEEIRSYKNNPTIKIPLINQFQSNVGYLRHPVQWNKEEGYAILTGHPAREVPKFQLERDPAYGGFMWLDLNEGMGLIGIVRNWMHDDKEEADLMIASRHYTMLKIVPNEAMRELEQWIRENNWIISQQDRRFLPSETQDK